MSDRFTLRVMTYNTHLFGAGGPAPDFNDLGRLEEIVERVRAQSPPPDIIGFNEVFDQDLQDKLCDKLRDLYPHRHISKTEYIFLKDSGLFLVSKYPFEGVSFHSYDSASGWDWWADKGVLYTKIRLPDDIGSVGIAITHTQSGHVEKCIETRKEQLHELSIIINEFLLSNARMPLIVMGDINVPGDTDEYDQMMNIIGLSDAWRKLHPENLGYTFDFDENDLAKYFKEDGDIKGRLDYVLYTQKPSYYAICDPVSCELVKYRSEARIGEDTPHSIFLPTLYHLSDHYGLTAEFDITFRPVGTITYQIDTDLDSSVDIETPALRSLLAWMEHVAIGYAPAEVGKEAPLLRIGFVDSNLFESGMPAIERLGAVWLNPAPLIDGLTWSWGQGYDPASRQLDLAYTLQHFVGRALHSLSPNSSDVDKILAEQNSVSKSVMLPYDPTRQLVDSANRPDPDHSRHLKKSDTDYMTELYTARPSPIEWKDKAAALADNATVKAILEEGLTGIDTDIVSIRRDIENLDDEIDQAQIPIAVDLYIDRLHWYGPVEDWGCNESGEHRFTATLTSSDPKNEERPRTSSATYPEVCNYVSIDPPADFSPKWGKPFVSIPSVLGIVDFHLVVVQVDGFLNGDNESTDDKCSVPNVEGIIKQIRLPQGPAQTVCKRIGDGSNWYANIRFVFRTHAETKSIVAANRAPLIEARKVLKADLSEKMATMKRLRTKTPGDLARLVGDRLVSVMERS